MEENTQTKKSRTLRRLMINSQIEHDEGVQDQVMQSAVVAQENEDEEDNENDINPVEYVLESRDKAAFETAKQKILAYSKDPSNFSVSLELPMNFDKATQDELL